MKAGLLSLNLWLLKAFPDLVRGGAVRYVPVSRRWFGCGLVGGFENSEA